MKNICLLYVESDTHKGNFDDRLDVIDELKGLSDFNLHINTNVPNKFNQIKNVSLDKYTRPVFSYVEKLIYAVKKSIELEESVLLVDASKLDIITDDLDYFKSLDSDTILTQVRWEDDALIGLKYYEGWHHIREYCKLIGLDYSILIPKYEHIIYFPYNKNSNNLLTTLEEFKIVLEFSNLWHKPNILSENDGRWGFGQGEGIVLIAALEKLNMETKEFEKVNKNKYMLEYKRGLGSHFSDTKSPLVMLNNFINCGKMGANIDEKYQEVCQHLFTDETTFFIEEQTYNFIYKNYYKLSEYFIIVPTSTIKEKQKHFSDVITRKYGLHRDCWVFLPKKPIKNRHLFDIVGYKEIKNSWFKSSKKLSDTKKYWVGVGKTFEFPKI
jgi:hypothetical protein